MACCPCLELMKQVGGDGCCDEGNSLSVELVFEHPPRWFRFVSLSRKRTLVYRCLLCETRISKEVREIRRMVQDLFNHYLTKRPQHSLSISRGNSKMRTIQAMESAENYGRIFRPPKRYLPTNLHKLPGCLSHDCVPS